MTFAPHGTSWLARERPVSFALGFVSGFVDIAGYLALSGLFTANMTGNVLLAAVSLVQPHGGIVFSRVAAVPLFMLGVLAGWLIVRLARRGRWSVSATLLSAEGVVLTLFLVFGVVYEPQLQSGQEVPILTVGLFALVAMGLQNVVSREVFTDLPGTTAMTTNLTLFVLETVDWINERFSLRHTVIPEQTPPPIARAVPVLSGFIVGAIGGAYGVHTIGFWSITVPVAIVGLLAVAMRVQTAKR